MNNELNNLITDVKSSKEFSPLEGKQFLIALRQELIDFGGSQEDKATVLSEIMECEEKNLYHHFPQFSVFCAFSTYFDRIMFQFNHRRKLDLVKDIRLCSNDQYMCLDTDTIYSLGIFPSSEKRIEGEKLTLFRLMNKTCSKSGKLALKRTLLRPLADIDMINERFDTIDAIWNELQESRSESIILSLRQSLKFMCDIMTVSSQLRQGNNKAIVWKRLRYFVIHSLKITEIIDGSQFLKTSTLFQKYLHTVNITSLHEIRKILESVLDFNNEQQNIGILDGVDDQLDAYRKTYNELEGILQEVSRSISEEKDCDISTAYIPQFGYLIALDVDLADREIQKLKSYIRYSSNCWNIYQVLKLCMEF
ncbi:unnamed protein product [Ambrosiozyma monospora]|uniref:Unnamed protein product n=1 Tax=Ambrosiozyma monospora TaxID=43982 RepID=A0ACB5TBY8_AMBMO|nr:unnamed protein product [Ambrosiozyma monospora]